VSNTAWWRRPVPPADVVEVLTNAMEDGDRKP